jgi:ParB-like chromosome segregation protein Spo0J
VTDKTNDETPESGATAELFMHIPLGQLTASRFQPPSRRPDADLVESVRQYGVITPGLARPTPDGPTPYEIVFGHCRWRAAELAELDTMPFVVRDLGDVEALELMLERVSAIILCDSATAEAALDLLAEQGERDDHRVKLAEARAEVDRLELLGEVCVPLDRLRAVEAERDEAVAHIRRVHEETQRLSAEAAGLREALQWEVANHDSAPAGYHGDDCPCRLHRGYAAYERAKEFFRGFWSVERDRTTDEEEVGLLAAEFAAVERMALERAILVYLADIAERIRSLAGGK